MFKNTKNLKLIVPTLLATGVFTSCEAKSPDQSDQADSTTKTEASTESNWVDLLASGDLSNFRVYKKKAVGPKWQLKDGVVTLIAKGGGYLMTKKQYSSFEIQFDYMVSKEGNSGLMYHVQEIEEKPWQTGPEVQIIDNVDGHDPQKSGWLYGLYDSKIDATNPAGEWNTMHVIITPEKCEHFINGKKLVEYVKGSKEWNTKVAATKFAPFTQFGKPTKGHICFQDHGDVVSFRNIKIKDLAKD
ncbi:MAG: 3-keto-disaccharide hydrolase [Akkermansiaceae bacterium]